jgi:hypothetical protein
MEPEGSLPVHNSSQPVTILRQIKSIHTLPPYFFKFNFHIILPSMPRSSKWSLYFRFPHQNPECILFFPIRDIRPANLILLNLIRILYGELHKSWSSSICNFLQSRVTSCLFGPRIFLSALLFPIEFQFLCSLFRSHTWFINPIVTGRLSSHF